MIDAFRLADKQLKRLGSWPFLLLTAIALVRIVSTYWTMGPTFDEPDHIGTGMEWLVKGTYEIEPQHPPLARIAIAIGPYLYARAHGQRDPFPDPPPGVRYKYGPGNAILGSGNEYVTKLSLARAGVLPFFILAAWLVWRWSDELYGRLAAIAALLLFTTVPVVLAHAALATTDMAACAGFMAVLYAAWRWCQVPSPANSVWLGAAFAVATLSKFTAPVFFVVAVAITFIFALFFRRAWPTIRGLAGKWRQLAGATAIALVLMWAGYRFSFASAVRPESRPHVTWEKAGRLAGLSNGAVDDIVEARIPAGELLQGLLDVRVHNAYGHESYILGQTGRDGHWYFFPVVIFFKTPIALLLFVAIAAYMIIRLWDLNRAVPALAALAILLCVLPARINLGARHILPMFPLLTMLGGLAAARLLQSGNRWKAAAAAMLLASQIWSSVAAQPLFLGYTNVLAGSHPEDILVESDLDWGQDLWMLRDRLRALHVDRFAFGYFGSADLAAQGLPASDPVPETRPAGDQWVVVSLTWLKLTSQIYHEGEGRYAWLDQEPPLERVGTSYLIYHLH